MEFKCADMTVFGCERMDYVKNLMLVNKEKHICKNMCCIDCEDKNMCSYHCNRSEWPENERMIPTYDEELEMERLLGIRCYNCKKVINQEGHKMKTCSSRVECLYLCNDCFKRVIGDQSKYKANNENEQLSFL